MTNFSKGILASAMFSVMLSAGAQTPEFVVQTKKVGAPIQPTMYGLFFEDINYAADGGLYAELIKNRSFDFPQNFMGWKTFGNGRLRTDHSPVERNHDYVTLTSSHNGYKDIGHEHEGYIGM